MAEFLLGFRGRVRGSLLLLGVFVLAVPSASLAAPTWLAPTTFSAANPAFESLQAAVDPAGNAVVVWSATDGSIRAAARPAGGAWSSPQEVAAPGQQARYPRVGVDAAGNATVVWQRWNGTNWVISQKTRPAGGEWSRIARQLSTAARDAWKPEIAINPAGAAVAVWYLEESSGTFTVQASTRPADGGFDTTPANLSGLGEDAVFPQVALDHAGTAVAVWERRDGSIRIARAATRPAGGAWSAAENLSDPQRANAELPQIALDAAGNAVAIWQGFAGSLVEAVSRPAGGAWSAPELLSVAGASELQVAVDPAGTAVAVWRSSTIIQAATRPAGGAWGAKENLSAAGANTAWFPQVALDQAGNATAVWGYVNPFGNDVDVQAATRPAGGAWSPAANLAPNLPSSSEPQVAFDGAGNAVAAWEGSDGSTRFVQAAGFDAVGPVLAELSIPATGVLGVPLSFSVSPFDVWSALTLEPIWRFGDGVSAVGNSVVHTYSAGGTYDVTVSQADVLGNLSSTRRSVSIAAPTPPPPPPSPPPTTPQPPPARRDTKGPALSARALTRGNGTIRVSADGRFTLFCGVFAEPVSGSCGGQSLKPASAALTSTSARPRKRVLKLPMRSFRAQADRRVRVAFRLSRADLLRLKATRKVTMRGTVVARDLLGNATRVSFRFTLAAPKATRRRR